MKPVDKGVTVLGIRDYKAAKPDLIARLGEFCSYCEKQGDPQDLGVEHIYSQDAHPSRDRNWRNLLLACVTCNTYKRLHLGDGKQVKLFKTYLWPDKDNTANAFEYDKTGCVRPATGLSPGIQALAVATLQLAGLDKTPATAATYHAKGISYDIIRKREEAWGIAETALTVYRQNPTHEQMQAITDSARKTGFFSIWMAVFKNEPAVRREFILVFKACATCFDPVTTQPVLRGRL